MSIAFSICFTTGIIFGCIAIILTLLKEKGAFLVSGFNMLPKAQKKLYDQRKIVYDLRNEIALWTLVMAIGSLLAYLISDYLGYIAYGVWIVLLLKNISWNPQKAFERYKK